MKARCNCSGRNCENIRGTRVVESKRVDEDHGRAVVRREGRESLLERRPGVRHVADWSFAYLIDRLGGSLGTPLAAPWGIDAAVVDDAIEPAVEVLVRE